jgi:SH3-like domain-containing protein
MIGLAVDSHAVCIKVSKANIRMGPSTTYEKAWQVFRYMPFYKVGVSTDGTWYAVKDVDGDVNWIYKNLLTTRFHCAVVKSDWVNVRTGPGTNYRKSSMGRALRYDAFKVIKRQGRWVKVKDTFGEIGWIHRSYLWIQ